jgi:hypothetical protein
MRFQTFKLSFPMRVVLNGAVGSTHHGRAQVSAAAPAEATLMYVLGKREYVDSAVR